MWSRCSFYLNFAFHPRRTTPKTITTNYCQRKLSWRTQLKWLCIFDVYHNNEWEGKCVSECEVEHSPETTKVSPATGSAADTKSLVDHLVKTTLSSASSEPVCYCRTLEWYLNIYLEWVTWLFFYSVGIWSFHCLICKFKIKILLISSVPIEFKSHAVLDFSWLSKRSYGSMYLHLPVGNVKTRVYFFLSLCPASKLNFLTVVFV